MPITLNLLASITVLLVHKFGYSLKFHTACHEHDPWKLRSRHRDDLDISGIQSDKNLTKIADSTGLILRGDLKTKNS